MLVTLNVYLSIWNRQRLATLNAYLSVCKVVVTEIGSADYHRVVENVNFTMLKTYNKVQ